MRPSRPPPQPHPVQRKPTENNDNYSTTASSTTGGRSVPSAPPPRPGSSANSSGPSTPVSDEGGEATERIKASTKTGGGPSPSSSKQGGGGGGGGGGGHEQAPASSSSSGSGGKSGGGGGVSTPPPLVVKQPGGSEGQSHASTTFPTTSTTSSSSAAAKQEPPSPPGSKSGGGSDSPSAAKEGGPPPRESRRQSNHDDRNRVIISEDSGSMALKMTGGESKLSSSLRRPSALDKLSVDTQQQPAQHISVSTKEPYKSAAAGASLSSSNNGGGGGGNDGGYHPPVSPVATPSSRKSFTGGFMEARRKSVEVSTSRIRSSISLPLTPDLATRVQNLLSGMPESGALLKCMLEEEPQNSSSNNAGYDGGGRSGSFPSLSATAEEKKGGGKDDDSSAEGGASDNDALLSCLRSIFNSTSYQKLSAVKESLARVYVLTTAKHLISSLIKAKETLHNLMQEGVGDADMRTFPAILTRTLEALTALTPKTGVAPQAGGGGGGGQEGGGGGGGGGGTSKNSGTGGAGAGAAGKERQDSDRPSAATSSSSSSQNGFLYRSPVPTLVANYFRDLPMLSQAFIALVQMSLKVLVASDNVVRRVVLENAPRYFYSSQILKKDLDIIWQHIAVGGLFMEYYGHLSREAFLAGGLLPYSPLTKLEVFTLISIGTARHKLMLEKQRAAATGGGSGATAAGAAAPPLSPTTPNPNHSSTSTGTGTTALQSGLGLFPSGPTTTTTTTLDFLRMSDSTTLALTPPPQAAEMDPDTLDVVQKAFLSEEPFRCSPFLVTFATKASDPRPRYETFIKNEAVYPNLLLSLSRQLYIGRCTPESLEEYFHQHYEVVQDYMTCSDVPRIIDSALSEAGPLPILLQRGGAKWTFNLYADMVVADFTTRFYMDFHRRVGLSDSTVLAFSSKFAELQKPAVLAGIQELLGISPPTQQQQDGGPSPLLPLHTAGVTATLSSSQSMQLQQAGGGGTEVAGQGADPQQSSNGSSSHILLVSERLSESLRVADLLSSRDLLCACAMAEAMVVWYVLWARAALTRSVAAVTKATAGGGGGGQGGPGDASGIAAARQVAVFEALRRVCALCSDVDSIARFCTNMINRMRVSIEEGTAAGVGGGGGGGRLNTVRSSRSGSAATTPVAGGGNNAGGPLSPAAAGSRTPVQRKGFILSPSNRKGAGGGGGGSGKTPKGGSSGIGLMGGDHQQQQPNSPGSNSTPGGGRRPPQAFFGGNNDGGGGGLNNNAYYQSGSGTCSAIEGGADMAAYDVIVNDLVAMVGDLRLLSAQCLEHACEIATHMTRRIFKEQFVKANGNHSMTSFFRGGGGGGTTRAAVTGSSSHSNNNNNHHHHHQRAGTARVADGGHPMAARGESQKAGGLEQSNHTARRQNSSNHKRASMSTSSSGEGGEDTEGSGSNMQTMSSAEVRPWSLDLVSMLFRPLAEFCRKDPLCSSVLLPRLLEACLHGALDVMSREYHGRIPPPEARALHNDFLYLKCFMEAEQRHQQCSLSTLPVLDRIHVVFNALCLPASLSQWQQRELASLYLLPDAPKWIKMRSDKGRVARAVLGRSGGEGHQQQGGGGEGGQQQRPGPRLSQTLSSLDTQKFEKVYLDFESNRRKSGNN